MIICENFEKCQEFSLECDHKYPHKLCHPGTMFCDQTEGEVECLEIVLKRKEKE